MQYRFSYSDHFGLIRERGDENGFCFPEVWRKGGWEYGSPYVLDAVTGMGEDIYSCGEFSEAWTTAQAEAYAQEHSIDLYADLIKSPKRKSWWKIW